MPRFEYSGRDHSGALVSGAVDASTADDVAALLFGEKVTPIDIQEVKRNRRTAAKKVERNRNALGPDATTGDHLKRFFSNNKVEIDDLIMFARQMQLIE